MQERSWRAVIRGAGTVECAGRGGVVGHGPHAEARNEDRFFYADEDSRSCWRCASPKWWAPRWPVPFLRIRIGEHLRQPYAPPSRNLEKA
jgi:hypothetical protein